MYPRVPSARRAGEKLGKPLLGSTQGAWYQAAAALPALNPQQQQQPLPDDEMDALRARCEQLLEAEVQAAEREMARRNPGDYKWLQHVRQSGTTADKVAAVSLQVQVCAAVRFVMAALRTAVAAVRCPRGSSMRVQP